MAGSGSPASRNAWRTRSSISASGSLLLAAKEVFRATRIAILVSDEKRLPSRERQALGAAAICTVLRNRLSSLRPFGIGGFERLADLLGLQAFEREEDAAHVLADGRAAE